MNEHDWVTTNNALAMFQQLRGQPRYHPSRWFAWMAPMPSTIAFRKAMLFVCGCMREQGIIWGRAPDRPLIEFCEEWADTLNPEEMDELRQRYPSDTAARAFDLFQPRPMVPADQLMLRWFPESSESPFHADLLREIFGNPFEAYDLEPAWLTTREGLAVNMARHIYDNRQFADLPILADALEDVGCTIAPLLEHLRDPKPHLRGCWALDLLLDL